MVIQLNLGDRAPSQLLREIKRLGGAKVFVAASGESTDHSGMCGFGVSG